MKKKPNRSIFDALFGEELFGSFFQFNNFNFSESEDSGFPADDDVNYHKTEENVETKTHVIKKEIWTSVDGASRFERTSSKSKNSMIELPAPSKKEIQLLLDKAVESQDFEKAIELRDQLKDAKE